ncbi:MAG: triose-phosphate isomerase [Deltaproteobacteria bacterium]|nr:triose-phosphate isomerase [Deltaproteobacteria bacterium]
MMRRPIVAGNWKMHTDLASAVALAKAVRAELADESAVDVVLIPPFPFLAAVAEAVAGSPVGVGAQDCRAESAGAYTGDVSPPMIASTGAAFCVVGHSERREYHAETNAGCNAKIRALLAANLTPIYCVGERLDVREADGTLDLVETQVRAGLDGLSAAEAVKLVLAYEPVWAIGTGKVATPKQAQEVHAHIRSVLTDLFGADTADAVRVQYGGSVKADNARELLTRPDIDGALVGGASLRAFDFASIVRAVRP